MLTRSFALLAIGVLVCASSGRSARADGPVLHRFERQQLTDVYYSEGANAGDLNRDGVTDIVHGPYWFAGPDYKTPREIYPAKAQPRERYSDNFFSWIYDFNGDGWNDVLTAGFPGTPALVYENPKDQGFDRPWPKHQAFDQVSNESPHFIQIVGDERPELVCTHDGAWGYATLSNDKPFGPWDYHAVSADRTAPKPFGHGLGVGDVDGDQRLDLLTKDGWYQQPASLAGDPAWAFHAAPFAPAGGAEMHAYDVDGDGDNDVITSLRAHEFGLAWYEQLRDGDRRVFRQHLIMGSTVAENRYGILFSELHSVHLADMDGDGLKDIVTGKTYWSHHTQSPMWDAGAVVYWFKLSRGADGVDWIPYLADGEAGIGRQIVIQDVNGDKLPDIVVGGMKGAHVLTHRREEVTEAVWRAAQPRAARSMANGLKPDQAARQMTVPPGFDVQLAAGEPQVHQPIAFALDARGRLWVAEAYTYPVRAPEGKGSDKVVILEDTDGNGTLDKRQVFAEGLNLVSGMELGFGGVWLGAAPYLLFIPDQNGDDKPDGEPQVLLDGFGYHDTHETLNSFLWGPDGWLYGCQGVFTHSRVGKPGTPDERRTPINAGVWRYHPQRHEFEVFAWGTSNPWGVDFDDHGQAFVTACVIPHLFHVIQGARYERQAGQHFNPYTFDDIKTIADHAHYAGNIRDHAWWGHEPTDLAADTSAAGGGHAHCGAMIYLGDNWPAEHRNRIFFNNVHGNRVNCDLLERRGSGFVGRHGRDLLLANDHWFRGINLKYGPDGGVYLIDWYDPNACHRVNPGIWDRTNGRIYKINYVGEGSSPRAVRPATDLARLSEREWIDLQRHGNDWYVRTARRLLQERGVSAAGRENLLSQLKPDASAPRRLRALWALHATSQLDEPTVLAMLDDADEFVRGWAVQLTLEDQTPSAAVHSKLVELGRHDRSPVVRLYLASALQRLPIDDRWPLATALLTHAEDAEDHNLPLQLWFGVEPLVPLDPTRAVAMAFTCQVPTVSRFILRRAASESRTLDSVIAALESADEVRQRLILSEMLQAFEGRVNLALPTTWTAAYDRLAGSGPLEIRELADQVAVVFGDQRVFPQLRQLLTNPSAPLARRQHALQILVRGRDAGAGESFRAILTDSALRGAAIRALAAYDDPLTPPAILANYGALNADERRDAVSTLVARPNSALLLLAAIEQDRIPRTDLHAYHVRQLLGFNNERLNGRIQEVWGDVRATNQDKQEQIGKWKQQLAPRQLAAADISHGRLLFSKNCATCHRLFGEGQNVGPDITGSNRANLDYILENIVDPSAVLGKDYRMTIVACSDGRIVSGLVQKETDSAVTLRTINDTVVVPKSEIDERKLSELSLMPERLLDALKPTDVRDLVAYLSSPTQVALRGPRSPIDAKTGKVPGAIEAEGLTVIKRTAGRAAHQKMGDFSKDVWSGADQLWWMGAKPGDKLELQVAVETAGKYTIELVLTRARDYGVVQLLLDGQPLGGSIDLFHEPDVITTGVLDFGPVELNKGDHSLGVEILGANPEAQKAYMFGIDYLRLVHCPE